MSDPIAASCREASRSESAQRAPAARNQAIRALRRRAFAVAFAIAIAWTSPALAGSSDSMQGLDEQVQEIKSDVLSIAAELRQLEEKLLYPSDTQVAVFVSIAEGDLLELDSVQIRINGEPAAHHIYSFKELAALRKGGTQRVYTGNLPTGTHKIEVSLAGTLPGGSPLESQESFSFEKDVEPKVVGLTFSGGGGQHIQVGDW